MRLRHSLIATAMLAALGFAGQAAAANSTALSFLGDSTATATDDYSGNDRNNSGAAAALGAASAAANNNSAVSSSTTDSFNRSAVVANTVLRGAVTGNSQDGIGNLALQSASANGGSAGAGGSGAGGGLSASQSSSAGGEAASLALGGTALATANGGGSSSGSTGLGNAAGGDGGDGGDGGINANSAGSFDMSANMSAVANTAAGIIVVAQNSGFSSLIQQGVTVQANLSVGN